MTKFFFMTPSCLRPTSVSTPSQLRLHSVPKSSLQCRAIRSPRCVGMCLLIYPLECANF